ncbi:DUF3048 domain-containing protein [Georgenia yuyongxinii]|uniref:DUF3048 domain-containing protein n=1 Tax=Georgenia yuyongxinii TaxID=2589797 RepID=A0A5B8C5Z3_9MICO|nr:DUF3048 domain-containing protein [Georgenia yuyongxinii]QDC25963.1 DUF3048 domain-containing protein [Georgenia yuyongxinii]
MSTPTDRATTPGGGRGRAIARETLRRRRPRRGRLTTAVLASALLALAACTSQGEPEPAPSTTASAAPSVSLPGKPVPQPLPARWPLTGVAGEIQERPALSVKVENSAAARPQTGLEDADVVWEELVEGGITRFNAVYHSVVPGEVGPIRSVRPMDAAIAAPLGGLMAFSGGQVPFVQQIRDAGLQVLSNDEGVAGMYRVGFRRAPHNVYGSGPDLLAQADADHSAPPPQQLVYAWHPARASAVLKGTLVSVVDVSFPRTAPGWTWDGAADPGRGGPAGAWVRDDNGVVQTSAAGARLLATNVVVLRVQVVDTGSRDPAGNPVPETVLTGEGDAVVASGGKVLEARWSKAATADPVVLTDPDGGQVTLVPGTTWIELVPVNGGAVSWQ